MASTQSLRVVVTGLIAQHPMLGGVTWDYVQYAIGLAGLGHDVYYVEDSGEWPYTVDGGASGHDWVAHNCAPNVEHLAQVMNRFGFADRWAYRFPIDGRWFGMSDARRGEVLKSADLIINVSGTLERPREYCGSGRLIYVDSDPVFTQIKLALPEEFPDFRGRVDAHGVHFSFGEKLSETLSALGGRRWRPTRQPIVLDQWRPAAGHRDVYTTVMSWTSYKPLRYQGQTYGQKDVEFSRFTDLPARVAPVRLEVAVAGTDHVDWQTVDTERIGSAGEAGGLSVAEALSGRGWSVVDPLRVCAGLDAYRGYVEGSKAEWAVAKNGYVRGAPGWFSCRSACYLAAGRPVIVQDTGFGAVFPVGEGILSFSTVEEATLAIQEVEAHYDRHARAARSIAGEYFDSRNVLTRLVETALN